MLFSERWMTLKMFFIYVVLFVIFRIGAFLKQFPATHDFLRWAFNLLSGTDLPPTMYWKLLFGKEMLENVWRSILVDMNKKVKLDNKAFNSPLVSLSDEGFCRLLDFAKGDRPLVVNFGSSTCPIFMKKMLEYEKMIVQFKDVADFVIVYIEEAHPSDGWAFDENNNIPTHSSQTERCVAARQLSSQNAICPVLVDSMLNAANVAYGALPIRLYIIRNNHVVYQGGAGPMGYCMDDVINWLSAYTGQKH